MATTKEQVLQTLQTVQDPELHRDLVSLNMVRHVAACDGVVTLQIKVSSLNEDLRQELRTRIESALKTIDPPVTKLEIEFVTGLAQAGAQKPRPQAAAGETGEKENLLPGVKHIIAVGAGKGGVGKSTTAVNLALGLAAEGKKVGILDADIYGPSLPRLLGLKGKPETVDGKVLKPMEAYGLKAMSMGFLVEEETPMIWRGPMVMSALTQMLREVEWGELDVLVVDMPPGTGDAQLTMAQNVPLAGAVIVSTPQDLALIDARKGLSMFRKVDVPILGIVENMSYFICPDCGGRHDIFGHGGARDEATRIGVPFLGEVPLAMPIRETSDAGRPVVATAPDGPHAKVYLEIAARVRARLEELSGDGARVMPEIVFE